MDVIDRRLNPSGKSLPNRQRFLRRARKAIREAVREASAERSIKDAGGGGAVSIPVDGIEEPRLRIGSKGSHERVLPGNREFIEGDRLPRPPGGGQGGGSGSNAGRGGDGEDDFQVVLSPSEFLEFFLEDLELPDLERRKLSNVESEGVRRAGFTTTGSPMNLAVTRTMRTAMSRRIALRRPRAAEIRAAEAALGEVGDGDEARGRLEAEVALLRQRARAIPYIDPIDLRYRRLEHNPRPIAQAVVFCLMDVSGSMSQHMKDVAKRFFMLLYVFLTKRYKLVEVVFVRHTDEAKEVDEETFFQSRETGGTRVSSALMEMLRIVEERYPPSDWNIYVAQASDGDNEPGDNGFASSLMTERVLPICQYFAYLEVDEPHHHGSSRSSLWRAYDAIQPEPPAMRRVTSRQEIYPVFRELFRRHGAEKESA